MRYCVIAILFLIVAPAMAQDEPPPVTVTHLGGQMYMLEGRGGVLAFSAGADGVALVDAQYAPMTPAILAAIREISDGPIRYVINTHWHGDHTGGNLNMAGEGAIIVAHHNVRRRMSSEQFMEFGAREVPASPPAALPSVTFSDSVTLHVNGEPVVAKFVPGAHTDGDSIVLFTESDVLHMGDAFWNDYYPRIDLETGATVQGMMEAVRTGLTLCREGTQVIAGHGGLSDCAGLQTYLEMLETTTARVEVLWKQGRTLEEIIELAPNADYDEVYGRWYIKPNDYLMFVFRSLENQAAH
jgi:glyoxylase-like metal-dependent hydrolase (beta-lactamase superfamily II)